MECFTEKWSGVYKRESLKELEMEWSVKGSVSQSWKWSGVYKGESHRVGNGVEYKRESLTELQSRPK